MCGLARRAAGSPADVGFVVGLTNAAEEILSRVDDAPLLIPGLGAQGGDARVLASADRKAPMLINVSRGVMFPPAGQSPAAAAEAWAAEIRAALV